MQGSVLPRGGVQETAASVHKFPHNLWESRAHPSKTEQVRAEQWEPGEPEVWLGTGAAGSGRSPVGLRGDAEEGTLQEGRAEDPSRERKTGGTIRKCGERFWACMGLRSDS